MRSYHFSEPIGDVLPYWRVFNDLGKLSGYIRSYQGNREEGVKAPVLYRICLGEKVTCDSSKEKCVGTYETLEYAKAAIVTKLPTWR